MTREELIECTEGLDARDFSRFAERIAAMDPALGETVRLHAEAADGNSPDLIDWISGTEMDDTELVLAGYDTAETARAWWLWKYADGPKPEKDQE